MSAKEKRDRKKNQTSNGIGGHSTSTTFNTNHHTWPNILESENRRTRNGHLPIKNIISSKEINTVESTIKDDKTNRSAQREYNRVYVGTYRYKCNKLSLHNAHSTKVLRLSFFVIIVCVPQLYLFYLIIIS